jgi:uncharacterized membrane protein
VQGILGGLVLALGYLIGQIVALIWRAADLPRLKGRAALALTVVVAIPLTAFFVWVLGSSLTWQNDLRLKMGMEPAAALHLVTILLLAFVVFAIAYALGRFVASLFRLIRSWFYRIMPPRRANVLGLLTVVLILFVATRDGIVDRVVTGLDESYEAAQELFQNAPPAPDDPRMTGSAASLIDWGAMGKPGRDFVTLGPTAEDIAELYRAAGAGADPRLCRPRQWRHSAGAGRTGAGRTDPPRRVRAGGADRGQPHRHRLDGSGLPRSGGIHAWRGHCHGCGTVFLSAIAAGPDP